MKKIFLTSLFLAILGLNSVYAGGGEAAAVDSMNNSNWETNYILQGVKISDIKDKSLQTVLAFNSDIILQNNMIEDWEYNNNHFFTKKIKLSGDISSDIKSNLTKVYLLGFPSGRMYNYKDVSTLIDSSKANFYSKVLDKNNLQSEYIINTDDLQKYIVNEYGDSMTFILYGEFATGDKFPLSFTNNYVYINNNKNLVSKRDFLANLYFTKYPDLGYVDFSEKLKPVFLKIKTKTGTTEKYISALRGVEFKLQKIISDIDTKEKNIASKITKEEDFSSYLNEFGPSHNYNDISYALASEIKSVESDSIIDDLFNID